MGVKMNKKTLKELKEKFEEGKKIYDDYRVSFGQQYLDLLEKLNNDDNEEDNIFEDLDVSEQFTYNMIVKVFEELATHLNNSVTADEKNIKKLLNNIENNDKQTVKLLNKELEKMETDFVSYEQLENLSGQLFDEDGAEIINGIPGLKDTILLVFETMVNYSKIKSNECSKIVEILDKKYLNEEELELRK